MSKYRQKKEDGAEASRHQESFKGNNTVHIDIPDTNVSPVMPGSVEEMDTVVGSERRKRLPRIEYVPISGKTDMRYKEDKILREIMLEGSSKPENIVSEEPVAENTVKVEEYNEDMNFAMLKETYDLIKGPTSCIMDMIETNIFEQKTPLGNTVLHMAAGYNGNSDWVTLVAEIAPELLPAKNSNDNTALHVAAEAGNISSLMNLLDVHFCSYTFSDPERFPDAVNEILAQNKQGNTFIHEALLNCHKDVMMYLLFSSDDAPFPSLYKTMVVVASLFRTNKQDKSILYLAIEAGFKEVVEALIMPSSDYSEFDKVIPPNIDPRIPAGKSPFLAAILKQDREILDLLLSKAPPVWVKLRDTKGRTPLHFAASRGYLDSVHDLLNKCDKCAFQRDKYGFFPLHLASDGGHVQVVKELLRKEYCPDSREFLDKSGRNFLHLATASGKFSVLKYILKSNDKDLVKMINEKDANGNTLLHLATMRCHPKIVHALTWDKRVKLNLVNGDNQTALDVCTQTSLQNPSLSQRLTWLALKSAGVPYADPFPNSIKVPSQKTESLWKKEAPNMDQYKDRINTLILVSTLIVTVTFAAGFTLPGGLKDSKPGEGMALMLHRMWFKLFIFCITISMYGAISVTIILLWAQLGDLTMAILALDVAKYCLGVILATLSLAFLAGVHLVISDLSWLSTTVLAMSFTFILMLLLLYILIWLPSTSNKPIVRYISYYPFLMLASLIEYKEKAFRVHPASESKEAKAY